jgi:hypothetical protein
MVVEKVLIELLLEVGGGMGNTVTSTILVLPTTSEGSHEPQQSATTLIDGGSTQVVDDC